MISLLSGMLGNAGFSIIGDLDTAEAEHSLFLILVRAWSDSTVGRTLTLHATELDSFRIISDQPLSQPGAPSQE